MLRGCFKEHAIFGSILAVCTGNPEDIILAAVVGKSGCNKKPIAKPVQIADGGVIDRFLGRQFRC